MPFFIQSNTQEGEVVKVSGQDLTAKEGYLATLDSNGHVILAISGAQALYVVGDANSDDGSGTATGSGADVVVIPLDPKRNVRLVAAGALAAGIQVMANGSGQPIAATGGNYVVGVTEEAATTAGQYVLVRPCTVKI